jgi:CTP:molybdopterin cytidylyltransferase MocA
MTPDRIKGERPKPALVLLAAGASRRLGTCKALVDLTPSSPLELLLAAGATLDDVPALVITGRDHDLIAEAAPAGVEVLHNADWAAGRTGSVRAAALARPDLDLCLAPVDVPLVPSSVFAALAAAWTENGFPGRGWLAPRYIGTGAEDVPHGAFGHPIVVGRDLLAEVGSVPPDTPLRALRGRAGPLFSVDVEAREVLDDLDRPADLERLRIRPG